MTNLKKAQKTNAIEDFIKEHEADPEGDLDKLDEAIRHADRGSVSATRPASPQDASDD